MPHVELDELEHFPQVDFYGYAVAGGGRGIERVDISINNGKKWLEAVRLPKLPIEAQRGYKDDLHRPHWAWTLWQLRFVKLETPCIVVVKAVCGFALLSFTSSDIIAKHMLVAANGLQRCSSYRNMRL